MESRGLVPRTGLFKLSKAGWEGNGKDGIFTDELMAKRVGFHTKIEQYYTFDN